MVRYSTLPAVRDGIVPVRVMGAALVVKAFRGERGYFVIRVPAITWDIIMKGSGVD
jgi:hypothetical protein